MLRYTDETKIIDNNTLRIILNEGKKHQIRIVLDSVVITIISFKRVCIGNIN